MWTVFRLSFGSFIGQLLLAPLHAAHKSGEYCQQRSQCQRLCTRVFSQYKRSEDPFGKEESREESESPSVVCGQHM